MFAVAIAWYAQEGNDYTTDMMQKAGEFENGASDGKESTVKILGDMRRTLQKSMQQSGKVSAIQQLTKEIMEIAEGTNLLSLKDSFEAIDETIGRISETMDKNSEGIGEISGAASVFAKVLHGINHEIENCDHISDKMRECLAEFHKTEEKKAAS